MNDPYQPMKLPIVIVAFGTTTKAQETYQHLHKKLTQLLPQREIIWSYSSKRITKTLRDKGDGIQSPAEVLTMLAQKGHTAAIVQSLHLFPGTEFHSLQKITTASSLSCKAGLPLLTAPEDYEDIATLLEPSITSRPERAILVLGHGTTHPSWTGYYSLEKILRKKYGNSIHVGVVEHYPDSSTLAEELGAKYTEVTIIPFFLICGMHYRRDIIAGDQHSWSSQLQAKGLDVEVLDSGIGLLPGIEDLLVKHIKDAESNS
ncbi:sirohydrochlorin cobaltochelatase [Desulforhopalus sp. 52FAK]